MNANTSALTDKEIDILGTRAIKSIAKDIFYSMSASDRKEIAGIQVDIDDLTAKVLYEKAELRNKIKLSMRIVC